MNEKKDWMIIVEIIICLGVAVFSVGVLVVAYWYRFFSH